ncbi:tyrosine-type recombinase/integrase [Arhodomonas sp. AD133]|uniref:tyrosine-type recombinase/integrase n=1 Tax=Arhodomonas sp. AD133 TaxID=3415009 RepID=UPI003EBA462F
MTPLRQQMIEAMRVRGFSARTHQSYLGAVTDLARYYRRSPEVLSVAELGAYFRYLACERELSGASCRLYLNAIRFLYLRVLGWPSFDVAIAIPKRAQRIPELLTRREVVAILAACANLKHRMLLATCYGAGLRVSELMALRVCDIDGERRLLRVRQGKGAKDRLVPLGATLLTQLRAYYRVVRPPVWLFPRVSSPQQPLSISTAQRVFTRAKARAGVVKVGGIHGLRHAYATHQLEGGLPVHRLQQLLGHQDLHSTQRYLHWVGDDRESERWDGDLLATLGEVNHG